MESYSKMRNEFAAALSSITSDIEIILQILDGAACNYNITDRDLNVLNV